jgi:uncharacterized protein (TIGR02466 family)|tara:strand:+ start:932 stop:1516 length:585 start_codon:yes stop_codon:yes gene_type:complete
MKIEKFFPTLVGFSENKNHKAIENNLVEKCYKLKKEIKSGGQNWIAKNTYNTSYTYNLFNDEDFKLLNDWVVSEIKSYADSIGYDNNLTCDAAWFNSYKKYDYQDVHEHSPNTISAIYFLKANPNTCAKTYFYSSCYDGLQPKSKIENIDTNTTISVNPLSGLLLVFRSNIKHSVEQQLSNDERISLAYNFKIK